MGKDTGQSRRSVHPHVGDAEGLTRRHGQALMQWVLGEEVTTFLGRVWHERRRPADVLAGCRSRHGMPRRIALRTGTIAVRRSGVAAVPVAQ